MTVDRLQPRIELLQEEYVLVQAWKKTAGYIRYHNWFSDTLELDRTAVNLPTFLTDLAATLQHPDQWVNDPLRIVPAPKSQRWHVSPTTGAWEPREKGVLAARLRPLAHVSFKDQVIATAIMLCLADRVETRQGDPRNSTQDRSDRRRVVSYGNRLFCDAVRGGLRHRWGSAKLYRAYYQDYKEFLSRPEVVAKSVKLADGQRVVVVESDLRQFYDRVRPALLADKLDRLRKDGDSTEFFDFAKQVLNWRWHPKDERVEVPIYTKQAGLDDFSEISLPQGLVSAGFFANIVLLDFDDSLRSAVNEEIAPGILLTDACRYVDDLRLVLTVRRDTDLDEVEDEVFRWLANILNEDAPGLEPSRDKTKAAEFGAGERSLIRQSTKMKRIQSAVSGGFDAIGGQEILDAIQGLMRAQHSFSQQKGVENDPAGWRFSPVPDVRDETVTRFAAVRFRTAFRSVRPLLEEGPETKRLKLTNDSELRSSRSRHMWSQSDIDDEARAFALGLIERWVADPSNVRLLRVGLDLWPDSEVLEGVLDLLRPFTEKGGHRPAPRRVAWYCLSEVLRAGATETGFVEDGECIPARLDLEAYRAALRDEAVRLISLPAARIPWYLRQQALLFLAAHDPAAAPVVRAGYTNETRHYREMIRFLRGEGDRLRSADFATLAVLSRRAFNGRESSVELASAGLTPSRQNEIGKRDPSFALELLKSSDFLTEKISARLRDDLCLNAGAEGDELKSLAEIVIAQGSVGPLRNELTLLRFANAFLLNWQEKEQEIEVITPRQVRLKLRTEGTIADVSEVKIVASRVTPDGSMYRPPTWCPRPDRWRFQLGFLLRFILATQPDFTRVVRPPSWREQRSVYRAAESHWYQRLYGLFNSQPAFGDDWLPITEWTERLLSALLHWPGCRTPDSFEWVSSGVQETRHHIQERISMLEAKQGPSSGALLLPMIAERPTGASTSRCLRACIVQTVIPSAEHFEPTDLRLNGASIRKKHRNHLSAALAAVERMLDLRETHKKNDGQLDWLILPELAVHPRDVNTHLVPFARAHRTIILAGLTYEELFLGQPLVNSALWIIPEWTNAYGLQMRTRRQGKLHLSPNEEDFNGGSALLQGFRPCQWLIGYPWSDKEDERPVWLTASICYDATDLRLAADLREESDVFAIPALNKDVRTFDQMALALHYHMFQLVVVANNGQYGGSNAYWPSSDAHVRQVFHLHGQPQASIAFLEIDDIQDFLERQMTSSSGSRRSELDTVLPRWKFPPAGVRSGDVESSS